MCPSKALRRVCQGCKTITQQQRIDICCPTARKQKFAVISDCPYYQQESVDIGNYVCDSCVESIGWDRGLLSS